MYVDEWRLLNGVYLHFQDWRARAEGRAAPILLLPGLTQQSHTFDPVAARLSQRRRCLALDLRGRGESSWAPGTYAIPQYVADVLALLDALGLDAVHVLGTSLGGLVGLSLAAAAPERLHSLVLNDIGPDIDPRGAARVAAYAASVPAQFPDLSAATAWAVAQYPWLEKLSPPTLAEAMRWTVRRVPGGGWRLKFDPAVGQTPRPSPAAAHAGSLALWASLEALRCAALLIRGSTSDIISAEAAAAMERRQPRLRRVEVEGVGHAPTLAEPAAVAALEAFYLRESAPRSAP
jgi:pimeloyl-ACP methyl ester carboxylesterase